MVYCITCSLENQTSLQFQGQKRGGKKKGKGKTDGEKYAK